MDGSSFRITQKSTRKGRLPNVLGKIGKIGVNVAGGARTAAQLLRKETAQLLRKETAQLSKKAQLLRKTAMMDTYRSRKKSIRRWTIRRCMLEIQPAVGGIGSSTASGRAGSSGRTRTTPSLPQTCMPGLNPGLAISAQYTSVPEEEMEAVLDTATRGVENLQLASSSGPFAPDNSADLVLPASSSGPSAPDNSADLVLPPNSGSIDPPISFEPSVSSALSEPQSQSVTSPGSGVHRKVPRSKKGPQFQKRKWKSRKQKL